MAATLVRGQTFGATEQVTSTKLHNLVDLATISGIVNAEISATAAIAESKISFTGSALAVPIVCYNDAVVCWEDKVITYS